MATGIPTRRTGGSPVRLDYGGKVDGAEVLAHPCPDFAPDGGAAVGNMLFEGDNLGAMLWLLRNGFKGGAALAYLDPPYGSACNFTGGCGSYGDSLTGAELVEYLRVRLIVLWELLHDGGSLYLHLDSRHLFPMKLVLDELGGTYRSMITRRKCNGKNGSSRNWGDVCDYILYYTKGGGFVWNRPYIPWDAESAAREFPCAENGTGRRYKRTPIHAPGVRHGDTGLPWRGLEPPAGKHWQWTRARLDEMDAAGRIHWSANGNPRRKVYLDESPGRPATNLWTDWRDSVNQHAAGSAYPTEKNRVMLDAIVAASSNPGDLVIDPFAGSGSTLEAAASAGRRWIGIDCAPSAIACASRRMESFGPFALMRAVPSLSSPEAAGH